MRKLVYFVLLAAAPLSALQAQNMTVSDFLRRNDVVTETRQGPATPEYQRIQRELNESARLARNERRIARRENRAPRACLRPGVPATSSREIFSFLRAMPAAEQATTTVYQAYMQLMARKFPCRNR